MNIPGANLNSAGNNFCCEAELLYAIKFIFSFIFVMRDDGMAVTQPTRLRCLGWNAQRNP